MMVQAYATSGLKFKHLVDGHEQSVRHVEAERSTLLQSIMPTPSATKRVAMARFLQCINYA